MVDCAWFFRKKLIFNIALLLGSKYTENEQVVGDVSLLSLVLGKL
jgi:hypothetical protein